MQNRSNGSDLPTAPAVLGRRAGMVVDCAARCFERAPRNNRMTMPSTLLNGSCSDFLSYMPKVRQTEFKYSVGRFTPKRSWGSQILKSDPAPSRTSISATRLPTPEPMGKINAARRCGRWPKRRSFRLSERLQSLVATRAGANSSTNAYLIIALLHRSLRHGKRRARPSLACADVASASASPLGGVDLAAIVGKANARG